MAGQLTGHAPSWWQRSASPHRRMWAELHRPKGRALVHMPKGRGLVPWCTHTRLCARPHPAGMGPLQAWAPRPRGGGPRGAHLLLQPRKHALVPHELPDRTVAARLGHDLHWGGQQPLPVLHAHHRHQWLPAWVGVGGGKGLGLLMVWVMGGARAWGVWWEIKEGGRMSVPGAPGGGRGGPASGHSAGGPLRQSTSAAQE